MSAAPGTPEWERLVTASKVPAILGVSPWESPRSLWHMMRGDVARPAGNDATKRGHYLEDGVLAWWLDQHPEVQRQASAVRDNEWEETWQRHPSFELEDWGAATPDAQAYCADSWALVEAKTAAYDDDWGDPGTDAIPAYYLAQVFWQMHVSGIHRCYVPVLTSRLRFAEYVVDYDPAIGADLEARCRAFYDSLSGDVPPALDDTTATFESMKRLHPEIERGEAVELDESEAYDLVHCAAAVKTAEAADRLARSTVLEQMGRAQYATHNGVRVARRQPRGDAVTFVVTASPSDLSATEGSAA